MAHVFPPGRVGAALLLMRIQAGVFAFQWALQAGAAQAWLAGAIAVLGLFICVGILARVAAVLLCGLTISSVLQTMLLPAMAWQAFDLAAIGLAGAGAYSMDAWLFGRHVIRLRP